MLDRRRFLAAAAAVAAARPANADALPVPPSGEIGFFVLRNGTKIGEHHLVFTQSGDDLTVAIRADLAVKFAGITLFTYALRATERWSGGVFQSLDSTVNNNGSPLFVHAHKVAAGYDVTCTHLPEYTSPPNTLPLTYWNKASFYGEILNIQTGHHYPAVVTPNGWNSLPTANGGPLVAERFDITGKLHLSVWYDQRNQWSGLAFDLHGHETYEKIM